MEKTHINESTTNEDDTRCRFLCCLRSKWADKLRNPKVFMMVYGFVATFQGVVFTYFVGTMSTFEKHFQLKSQALGGVLSAAEFIPGIITLIGSYFCGSADRPRWLSVCMFSIGIGCYMITLPYYIFGVSPREDTSVNDSSSSSFRFCDSNEANTVNNSYLNESNTCTVASTQENNLYAIALCFLGYTMFNNGSALLFIIGTPYIDDNVQQKNSPIYLGVMTSMRSIGPLLGFVLSYACLKVYVNPTENTNLTPEDPQWIGAWWLGYIVVGTLTCLGGFFIGQFPIRLPSRHVTPAMKMIAVASSDKKNIHENEKRKPISARFYASVKEVLPTVRRLLTNVPFLLQLGNGISTLVALEGIMIYLSRYLEHQFRVTQSEASIWSGAILLAPAILGTIVVGYIIHRTKATARQLTIAMVISKLTYAVALACLVTLRCDDSLVLGLDEKSRISPCDSNCDCSPLPFAPVCGSDGKNYLSGCHAGCSSVNESIDTWMYQNCSCIPSGRAAANFCGNNCDLFGLYVGIMLVCNFLLSIEVLGEIMLVLRCVAVKDKAIAMGIYSSCLSLLVFIPVPLVYASIVDNACSLWSYSCGKRGHCLLYDMNTFRYLIHCGTAGLLIVAAFIDMLFWYKAKNIALIEEEEKKEINEKRSVTDSTETVTTL